MRTRSPSSRDSPGETAVALLDQAATIGLLSPLGGGYYTIHPALPWYFTTLYTTTYGPPSHPAAQQATRAYTHTLAQLGRLLLRPGHQRRRGSRPGAQRRGSQPAPRPDPRPGRPALGRCPGCLQGLRVLYERTGRDGEWARLVDQITPDFIDPATGGPLPGRDDQWNIITDYRVRLAIAARDWPAATRLQHALIARGRDQAATAQATPDSQLTPAQRNQIRTLAVSLQSLGDILREQEDPGCLPHYEEALGLHRRIGARAEEAKLAGSLGNAYMQVTGLRDLGQAEHWYQHSLGHRAEHDRLGRAQTLWGLGIVAQERFREARAAGAAEPVLLTHLNAALDAYQQALGLIPAGDAEILAASTASSAASTVEARDSRQALHHYQQALAHEEARGNTYGAGQTRYNIALLLQAAGRPGDALHYARAALHDYERTGPGATQDAAKARELIARLEQDSG